MAAVIARMGLRSLRITTLAVLAAALSAAALAQLKTVPLQLSVEQIIARNVAARGGLEAWRKIETMEWSGHIESTHAPVPSVLFVLEQKRPNRTRLEIDAMGQRTARMFNGLQGWKLVPGREGGPRAQRYTPDELKFSQSAPGIESPLIDYATKGNVVTLEGVDELEGRDAYRLGLRLISGERDEIWIDAASFLELRYDRTTDGPVKGIPARVVTVIYRDYKTYENLKIPSIIETGSGPPSARDRMVIEKVVLNPPLDDRMFGDPSAPRPRHTARFGTGGSWGPQLRMPRQSPSPGASPAAASGQQAGPAPDSP
ncbi:MAG: hypothetical protein JOZ03_02630 [Gammaproteobacteria bacterium]|nr:hypothetical protein [Gammaproteobacteria bacterium]